MEYLYLFIISVLSNLFSAFSGGGAGIIQLPAILLIFQIPFPVALATHKISTVLLGIGASLKFFENNKPERQLMSEGLIFGIPSVILGSYLINYIDETLARNLLGVLILFVFFISFYNKDNYSIKNKRNSFLIYPTIVLIGFLNGSLSAGTGLLYTIMLVQYYKMTFKEAIAYTLLIVGFFYNLVGAITLYLLSSINLYILPVLLIGSFIGGYLGATLAINKSNKTIKIIYQITTLIIAVKLLL